ncbi:cyclase family protein [Candidatus Nitrospira bockiana]
MTRSQGWIDVSVVLRNGLPHWPDNDPVRIERIQDLDRGDEATVSTLTIGAHTGTHMDAPLHFIKSGKGLDELPLDATIGPAQVVEIRDPTVITVQELREQRVEPRGRVLFKTRNSHRRWPDQDFFPDFVYLSTEAARWLIEQGVRTVGVDYLSVGGFQKNGPEVHRVLLGAGVWIIEGLDLSAVEPGPYDLICLPLKVAASDGAPARAVLRRRESSELTTR